MDGLNENFDIIIIGAGPGGSVAAKMAAENGYSVCMLEKFEIGEKGRYKACGGAMAWELVEMLDYPEDKIGRIIETLEIHHTDGETYSKKGKGAVVWRSTFDKFLSDRAVNEGVVLREREPMIKIGKVNENYSIRTPNKEYTAKYVIASDGATSPTLKKLNWPKIANEDLVFTITQELRMGKEAIKKDLGSDKVHLFFGINDLMPMGYAWLFPKENKVTMGWGNQINLINNLKEEYAKFENIELVKNSLQASVIERKKGHLIPVGLRPRLYNDNVFAVGDSGGLVDPISGKGIPYAMLSGKFAIESILKSEKKGKQENLGQYYEKSLNREFLNILRIKYEMRKRIFTNEENLKKFLSLWEKHRSSEIAAKGLI